jgi:AraC-like DNA-binding protein
MPDRSAFPARPDPAPFEAIHGLMLREFGTLVVDLGGEPDTLLRAIGITPGVDPFDHLRATYRQFVALLELAAGRLGCLDFGMQLAVRQARTAFAGPLGDGMRAARNLDDALNFVCAHSYAHSLAASIWRKPSLSGKHTLVGHDILVEGLPDQGQAMEYMLLVGNLAIADLTGQHVRARQVLFRHQPIATPKTYRHSFGCEVRFGRGVDAVLYSQADLSCPIPARNAQAYRIATTTIQAQFSRHAPPLHAHMRGLITHFLGTDHCTKEHLAAQLGLHPRTLARRLATEGTSFQRIKDQVRRDRLLYYTRQTRMAFTVISERLGFSEQAVMTRSCRKWFAMSPTDLRHAIAIGGGAIPQNS